MIPLPMVPRTGKGMGFTESLKVVISFLGITGITVMTAGFGNKNMCLLQTSRQKQGSYAFHSQGLAVCDGNSRNRKIFENMRKRGRAGLNKFINDLLKKGLGNFIDKSRDALIWDDEIYQRCSREEDEAEEKCLNMGLTKGQKKIIKQYVSDIRATEHRYADLSYLAGVKDTLGVIVSLGIIRGMELGEGDDAGK